jgi:hypothetical protein
VTLDLLGRKVLLHERGDDLVGWGMRSCVRCGDDLGVRGVMMVGAGGMVMGGLQGRWWWWLEVCWWWVWR